MHTPRIAFRERIVALHLAGRYTKEIVQSLNVSRKLVWLTLRRFKVTGRTVDLPKIGRPRNARTPELIKQVKRKIKRNPRRSMRKMAREAKVREKTIRNLVHKDLNFRSYELQKRHSLSTCITAKENKRKKVKAILDRVKFHDHPPIIFSDEKIFTVEATVNRQNNRIFTGDLSAVPIDHKMIFKSQNPHSVMVFAAVTTDGHKNPIIFVEVNTKINSDIYIEILKDKIYPWVLSIYGKGPFVFQQDGAPSHTPQKIQEWLTVNFPGFWDKSICPPYSPDLNVMDYSI